MTKEIVKAIYDIAHANGVTVDVAADMFKHNVVRKDNINKGSLFNFLYGVDDVEMDKALEYVGQHYRELAEAYINGTFDNLFEEE